MISRTLLGVSGTTIIAAAVLVGPASPAQAGNYPYPGVGTCLDWEAEGDRNYCKIRPSSAHVNVPHLVNGSGREVAYSSLSGSGRNWERSRVLEPGKSLHIWGNANAGIDIFLRLSWCPTTKYTDNCEGKLSAELKWKNPAIGWPWMSVDSDEHGFKSMERYTFEKAYGPAGTRGVAKFKAVRLPDMSSGTKVFEVDFTFAAR